MTQLEDRVRAQLHETAQVVEPAPLLERLDRAARAARRRHRVGQVAVAAAAAGAVAAGTLVVTHLDRPSIIEPTVHPPKVFRLSGATVDAPGRALIAVFTAQTADTARTGGEVATAHVQPVTGGPAVSLSTSDRVPGAVNQQLSHDGNIVVRESSAGGSARVEIVNLSTGAREDLGDLRGYCPRLSPDNRTLVSEETIVDRIAFIDARTGETLTGGRSVGNMDRDCVGQGWSPDGQRFAFGGRDGTLLMDDRGRVVGRIPGRVAVNSDMSWAPDGRSILLYDRGAGRYVVGDVNDGSETVLQRPADAIRPMGWAGSRIVWLVGHPGDQRLVSTDRSGADPRQWMRLDIGGRPVESVQWSRALTGHAG
jgi:Tol biopolymer transport system component